MTDRSELDVKSGPKPEGERMSGGRNQGDRPSERHESAQEIIDRVDREMASVLKSGNSSRHGKMPEGPTNYGPPSEEHERPLSQKGERDPLAGVGKNVFSKHGGKPV